MSILLFWEFHDLSSKSPGYEFFLGYDTQAIFHLCITFFIIVMGHLFQITRSFLDQGKVRVIFKSFPAVFPFIQSIFVFALLPDDVSDAVEVNIVCRIWPTTFNLMV